MVLILEPYLRYGIWEINNYIDKIYAASILEL